VSYADEAVEKIAARPLGVGVDAPLWWSSGRSAERAAPPSTVQTPNSLRGAALVQAAMFVQRLREMRSRPQGAFFWGNWGSRPRRRLQTPYLDPYGLGARGALQEPRRRAARSRGNS
jgi:hypothetical protein